MTPEDLVQKGCPYQIYPEEGVLELTDSDVSQAHYWRIISSSGLQFRHHSWEACYSQQMSYLGRHLCHPGETGPQLSNPAQLALGPP